MKPDYLAKSKEALMAGKYHKARPYSVEALTFYTICKYREREDLDPDSWLLIGIAARLALRMGYHRDPRHLNTISPFEGEMRRRTFFVVQTFELLLSFQAGLPAVVQQEECDTEIPSNLYDEDFGEDCRTLPPSRPPTDPTPMLYYCHKFRTARLFGRVARHALSLRARSYEETMKLDQDLRNVHADAPPSLRIRSLSLSIADPPHVILNRLNLEVTHLKSLCVLHRNYLSHEKSNPEYDYSRRTCTDAALRLLNLQAELHVACQPGGRFHEEKWMITSLVLHDFLLASMIICLDLHESSVKPLATSPPDLQGQIEKYDVLKHFLEMWKPRRAISRDARRATEVLTIMLSKIQRPDPTSFSIDTPQESSSTSHVSTNGENLITTPASSSLSSSWNAGGFDNSSEGASTGNSGPLGFHSVDPLNALFKESEYIDWVRLQVLLNCTMLLDLISRSGTHRPKFAWLK